MKKAYTSITIAVIMLSFTPLHSQKGNGEKTKREKCQGIKCAEKLTFDFEKKQFICDAKVIWHGSDLNVQVINVNKNLYEVSMSHDQINHTYTAESASAGVEVKDGADEQSKGFATESDVATEDSVAGQSISLKINSFKSLVSRLTKMDFEKDLEKFTLLVKSTETVTLAQLNMKQHGESFSRKKGNAMRMFEMAEDMLQEIKKIGDTLNYKNIKELEALYQESEKVIENAKKAESELSKLDLKNFKSSFSIANIQDDIIIVNITIKEKKEGSVAQVFSYTLKVRGKFKIDASSGAIFNAWLSHKNYEIQNLTIIDTETENQLSPIFPSVLFHAYRKRACDFNWGASFGFGITDGENVSFYSGLGVLLGEYQRFVMSAGLGLRKVRTLKAQYNTGQEFTEDTVPDLASITADPYKIGGFFAITYNLSAIKE